MDPQDYSARTEYRPPASWYQRFNKIGVPLISLGLAPHDAVVLEVQGRKSGKIRRTPILRTDREGHDYLVALAGEAQWVRNVRASEGKASIRHRRRRSVLLHELPDEERAPVIAAYLASSRERSREQAAQKAARFYFGLDLDASLEEIAEIADYYPVFRIEYV
jgi:deazaflavin-dependent oxidoreductase (nitroreductase family)